MPDDTAASQTEDVESVDLHKEIVALAAKNGETEADLPKMVEVRRSTYYAAVVRAHYKGRDQGYAQGLAAGLTARWPAWVWLAIGAACPYVVTFAVKLVVFVMRVYNS